MGVGYVISGEYFGWNLGLPEGGTLGMAIATVAVTVMYVAFALAYAELACAMPRAGGAFVYAGAALGPLVGWLAGVAQMIELVLAPPAIALAIGAYLHVFVPAVAPEWIAVVAYVLFTAINVWGVRQAAAFELIVTVVAVLELLVFGAVTLPHFSRAAFVLEPLPHGALGVLAAVPFAIWFYLGIEGVANAAEEARDPQRDLPRGFGTAIATLVALTALVFVGAIGVAGWRAVVYAHPGAAASDSPLPLAIAHVVAPGSALYHLVVGVGLFGLLASFHGLLLAAGRATYALGEAGHLPRLLGRVSARTGTPVSALVANCALGLVAIASGTTAQIITLSVIGALVLYAVSMVAMLVLRQRQPELARPFRTPLYPVTPVVALALAVVSIVAIAMSTWWLVAVFAGLLAVAGAIYGVRRAVGPPQSSL